MLGQQWSNSRTLHDFLQLRPLKVRYW